MVRITNRFLISTEKFLRSRFGAGTWEKFLGSLPTETRNIYHFPINPKGNVGFDHVGNILRVVEEEYKSKVPKILYELGLHNSADDLSATQRLLMKLISVEWVLKAAALLWKQRVINGGTMQIEHRAKGHVHARVTGFEQPTPQWWEYLTGWFTSAIQFSGGTEVKVQWLGGGSKPTDPADFDARWQ
jgi:hypothetical protein